MKTIAYYYNRFIFTACIIVTGCSQNGDFTLLTGERQSLDDYHGRWLVVNFWAEWCAPCIEEIPALNQLSQLGTTKDIAVIGVSYDPLTRNELSQVVVKWQIKYPQIASQPVPILPFSLPPTLPTNYLLNPKGRVVRKLVGKQDLASLQLAIQQAIDENQDL